MSSPPDANESNRSARQKKPGWFVTVCVIAIALGGTGLTKGLLGLAMSAIGGNVTAAMFASGGPNANDAGQTDVERALAEIEAIERKYAGLTTAANVFRLAVAVGLLLGGVWCLWGKRAGRTLLTVVLAAGLVFEIGDTALQTTVALDSVKPLERLGQAIDTGSAPADGSSQGALTVILHSLLWMGMCAVYVLQSAKGVYYLGGLLYLRRSSLDPLFGPSPVASQPT